MKTIPKTARATFALFGKTMTVGGVVLLCLLHVLGIIGGIWFLILIFILWAT